MQYRPGSTRGVTSVNAPFQFTTGRCADGIDTGVGAGRLRRQPPSLTGATAFLLPVSVGTASVTATARNHSAQLTFAVVSTRP